MAAGSGITVVVDAKNNTAQAFGSAAKGVKTVGEAADVAQRQLAEMDRKMEAADTRARRLAQAEEQAAEKARRLATDLAAAKRELAASGDESGQLSRKIERLTTDTRFAAIATDEYRRAANRAAADAREQARAYDRVADNARQAARAVEHLGAASLLTRGEKGGLGGLAGGLSKVLGGASGSLLGIGSSAGEGLFGTPIVGPALLAAGGVAALGVGAFAGASVGGATIGGLGLGGAGLGIAGAVAGNPDHFRAQWEMAIGDVKKRWIDSSKAFTNELDDGLAVVNRTLRGLPVEKVLAVSQSFVPPVTLGAAGGATELASGLAAGLTKAQPVVNEIGLGLAKLGHAGGDAFRIIGEGSEGGAKALHDLFSAVSATIRGVALLINGFEHLYDTIHTTVSGSLDFVKTVPVIGHVAESVYDKIFKVSGSVITLGRSLDEGGKSSDRLGRAWSDMAREGAAAALAAKELDDALTKTMQTQLAMKDASLAVAQGWIDLNKELKTGARTLDDTSQEGINNQQVIVRQIELLEQQREQAIHTGGDTVDAINSANAAYNDNIEKLRQSAYAAGFNHDKVDQLIDSLNSVPKNTTANVNVPGLPSALQNGISLGNALNNINGRTYEAQVIVHYRSQGQSLNAPLRTGGISHAAVGGPRAGLTEVGEEGPELLRMPTGVMVYPKANRNQMMMQAASGAYGGGVPSKIAVEMRLTGSGWAVEGLHQAQRTGDLQIFATAIVN